MNLKEKAKEAKEYGEVKGELMNLIDSFLIKYKEYENIYKDIFEKWVNKITTEFETIFNSEGFIVTTKTTNYSDVNSKYKTVSAILYDLEFELSITIGEYQQIRFLQTKPEVEKKNIIIRPSVKQHYMGSIDIKDDSSQNKKQNIIKISGIWHFEETNKKIKNAQFSINQMKELIIGLKKENDSLLDELEKIKTVDVKSIAIPTEKFGFENKKGSYEFENLSEFIEKI